VIAMNLKNRFRLVIFSMVALLVSISLIVVFGLRQTNVHMQESIGMDDLVVNLYELQILNSEYLDTPSERVKQQWKTKYDQIESKLLEQQNMPEEVKDALNDLQQIFARLTSLPDVSMDIETSQKRLRNQLATTLNLESQRIIDWASNISRHTKDGIVLHLMFIGAVTLAVMLVTALVVITMMILTARHILSCIIRLKEGAVEIASGRLGFQVEQAGNDEIAMLATAINQMSRGLMDSYENLHKQKVQIEDEMAQRQRIHEALKIKTVELKEEIEERKRAEGALRESEENYKNLIENANEAIFVAQDGKLVFINPMTTIMIGYSGEELMIKPFAGFIHPDDRDMVIDRHVRRMRGEELPHIYSFRIIRVNGKVIWVELNAVCVNWKGKPATLNFLSDITDRKRAEEEKRSLEERLQRSEKMEALGQLAGGVAHDLNNVLGVLTGYSELLLGEIPEGQRTRGYAEKILQSTEKGAAIIQDLLTLARRGVTASDVVNLNSVVSDFLKTPVFEKLTDYHPRVTFRTECDPKLLNIKGSPVHLEKTLMNLVSNAAESISGKGQVTIRTESRYLDKPLQGYDEVKEGDYAVLAVYDTGTGIPAENRKKIFEPFYTKKTMGRSGTGLGLAIVWGTVKDHNGYIDLQTEVGEGSTFTLYFPVTRDELIAQHQKMPIEQYMGNGESVLVVDDIAEQRDIAARLLTRLGYSVRVVSSGEEAVEYLKGNISDILVLDMIMAPGMDGLETYQRILEINPKQKAILVSGFSETDRVKKAQKLGAGAYVKKPYVIEKIGVSLRDELNRK
jgi:PAS domain S-box-containing protein